MVNITRQHRVWLVATLALTAAACGRSEAKQLDTSAPDDAAPTRMVNVEVQTVQPRTFTDYVRVVGTVDADRDVTVATEESGRVREIYVDKGAQVREGQPLVKIDDAILRAQLDQAEANAALAEETWQRQKRLWEDEQIGTELQYLQAKYGARTAAAQAQALRERVDNTVVRAPFDGLLEDRFVEVGDMVVPGARVGRVLDLTPAKVSGGVAERYAAELEAGSEAQVTLAPAEDRSYTGRIGWVGSAVDPEARTFGVEVLVPNPAGVIKPGMVANVRIALHTIENAIVVPQQAVIRQEQGYVVYVARQADDGTVRAAVVRVELGPRQENQAVIRSGLQPGDRVIVVGQQQVAAGDALRIVNGGEDR